MAVSHGHPDLLKAADSPAHLLSSSQMEVLAAICDTIIPSLPFNGTDLDSNPEYMLKQTAEKRLFGTSAAEAGVPSQVAGLMRWRLKPAAMKQVSFLLWLLTTRIGSLILFGGSTLVSTFPFVQPFAALPFEARHQALLKWVHSSLLPLRTIFKVFKAFTAATYFGQLDEGRKNPMWDGMGYTGPDPELLGSSFQTEGEPRPLEHAVIDLKLPEIDLPTSLRKAGYEVLPQPSDACCSLLGEAKPAAVKRVVVACDAAVVGSGCGGAVIAAQLAQAGKRVLLLEKGSYYALDDLSLLEGPSSATMYDGGSFMATEDGSVNLIAGSTVGGGSTINWAASFRTPPHVTREWSEIYKLQRFAGDNYTEAMDAVCKRLGVQAEEPRHSFQNQVLAKGAQKLGYPLTIIPRNSSSDHNCGWCTFGCRSGNKQSTADTWLVDAAAAGAVIIAGCTVERILHGRVAATKDKRQKHSRIARGVVARGGPPHAPVQLVVEAPIVVAACGSLQTPALLLRSEVPNPNIGKTLRLHPVTAAWGHFPEGTGPDGRSYEGGIMTQCCTVASNWSTSGYGCLLQTPSLHPALYSVAIPWRGALEYRTLIHRFARTAIIIAITRDQGHGKVTIDAQGEPAVDYTLQPSDARSLQDGLDHGLRMMRAAGASELGSLHVAADPFVNDQSDAKFEEYVARVRSLGMVKNSVGLFSAHQTGSCRMGVERATSVVDPSCESWEVAGLYLGDGSVLPTPPGVNPMITIQSVAFATGKMLVNKLA